MKVLYFQCYMGAAGDMLNAALLDLIDDKEGFLDEFRKLGIPGVEVDLTRTQKCSVTGYSLSVMVNGTEEVSEDVHLSTHDHDHEHEHDHHHDHEHEHAHDHHHEHEHEHEHEHHHHHEHSSYQSICEKIDLFPVPDDVKKNAKEIYETIALAEAEVHNTDVTQIHFHEVGSMDAIVDVLMFCMLIDKVNPDKVIVSPVHVGSGTVRCAHGILPVPAPATALILKDVPIYGGRISGELCTPTGAALLKHFADEFGDMPAMKVDRIGYGMGKKDFPVANCVRAFLGNTSESEEIFEIDFNVDDMTAEEISFAVDRIFDAGAREVFTTPVQMKKGRSGLLVTALVGGNHKMDVVKAIFQHTSTIGMREKKINRYILDRTVETEETVYGEIRKKVSSGYGVRKEKYEYDDLERIAKENGLSISEIKKNILNK